MSANDWVMLFVQMMALSLFTIGGAISAIPDMHRLLVDQRQWLSGQEFANAVTLAQIPQRSRPWSMGWGIRSLRAWRTVFCGIAGFGR